MKRMKKIAITGLICLTTSLMFSCSKGVEEVTSQTGGEDSSSQMPQATDPTPAPAEPAPATNPPPAASSDPKVASFMGFRAPKPETWIQIPPANNMQIVSYTVPGPKGEGAASLVVFYFGAGGGGGIQANIDRWTGQFVTAEGGPVEAKTEQFEANSMSVTLVELQGSYLGMGTEPTPDQLFLTSIIGAPIGNVFIRLVGPVETVEANREAYMAMINGLLPE